MLSQVTYNRLQFSRHRIGPPLLTERSDSIGCRRRQIRASSYSATGDNYELRVNEYWSLLIVKQQNRRFKLRFCYPAPLDFEVTFSL